MAIEPVNERPIFPSLTRPDAVGVSSWSTGMIRQLTTVFQQYGYKLNRTLTDEDLTDNGGEVLTENDLGQNGGNLPELDQAQTFTASNTFTQGVVLDQDFSSTFAKLYAARASNAAGDEQRFLDFDSADVVSGGLNVRVGRATDTTGDVTFTLFDGDDTASQFLRVTRTEGMTLGSPSGGSQGPGTLNAVGVYDDGTLLTDYVFDAELDGRIDAHAYDESTEEDELGDDGKVVGKRRRTHKPAWAFAANMNECDPKAYTAKWRQSRKLPAVERAADKPSVGELTQALLETCEVQAVHIAKLEERISALEANNGNTEDAQPRRATNTRD